MFPQFDNRYFVERKTIGCFDNSEFRINKLVDLLVLLIENLVSAHLCVQCKQTKVGIKCAYIICGKEE